MFMERYKAVIEYDGTCFSGFQIQKTPGIITVQGRLEEVLSKIFACHIKVCGAGRTDSGVHATGQVIHFDAPGPMDAEKLTRAINGLLKGEVSVSSLSPVPGDFHARFDAVGRHYLYLLDNSPGPRALLHRRAWHHSVHLDVALMRDGISRLVGTHDFTLFAKGIGEIENRVRSLSHGEIITGDQLSLSCSLPFPLPMGIDRPGMILFYFYGPSFLHSQVRLMVGNLVLTGKKAIEPDHIDKMLTGDHRYATGAVNVPGYGLYLAKVDYPGDSC